MAQQITATIYGMNNGIGVWVYSNTMSFPTQGIQLSASYPVNQVGGYYVYSIIKSLWEQGQPEYLTNKSVVQLATEANT